MYRFYYLEQSGGAFNSGLLGCTDSVHFIRLSINFCKKFTALTSFHNDQVKLGVTEAIAPLVPIALHSCPP